MIQFETGISKGGCLTNFEFKIVFNLPLDIVMVLLGMVSLHSGE